MDFTQCQTCYQQRIRCPTRERGLCGDGQQDGADGFRRHRLLRGLSVITVILLHTNTFDAIFLEFGAIRVVECRGHDVPDGKLTDFRRAVQAKQYESVVFSWVEWPDKAARDAGMAKFMQDPRVEAAGDGPFDGKRMIFGGFKPVVSLPQ